MDERINIPKFKYVAINVIDNVAKVLLPLSEELYKQLKTRHPSAIYNISNIKFSQTDVIALGAVDNFVDKADEKLCKLLSLEAGVWIPSGFDNETCTAKMFMREDKPIHKIAQCYNFNTIFKYYVSIIDNPKMAILIKLPKHTFIKYVRNNEKTNTLQ